MRLHWAMVRVLSWVITRDCFWHTFFQAFAELFVGSLELFSLNSGGVVFGDRVDEISKSLFQALKAGVDVRVHLCLWLVYSDGQRELLSTCKRETGNFDRETRLVSAGS